MKTAKFMKALKPRFLPFDIIGRTEKKNEQKKQKRPRIERKRKIEKKNK